MRRFLTLTPPQFRALSHSSTPQNHVYIASLVLYFYSLIESTLNLLVPTVAIVTIFVYPVLQEQPLSFRHLYSLLPGTVYVEASELPLHHCQMSMRYSEQQW